MAVIKDLAGLPHPTGPPLTTGVAEGVLSGMCLASACGFSLRYTVTGYRRRTRHSSETSMLYERENCSTTKRNEAKV